MSRLRQYKKAIALALLATVCFTFFEVGRRFGGGRGEPLPGVDFWEINDGRHPFPAPAPIHRQGDSWLDKYPMNSRYLVHVSLDKPIYRPGETLFARAPMLHALDLTPNLHEYFSFNVKAIGPRGETIDVQQYVDSSPAAQGGGGAAAVAWRVPRGLPGGDYVLRYEEAGGRLPPAERAFAVRALRTSQFQLSLEFDREGYGFGETAAATLTARAAAGGAPLAGAEVGCSARVDGAEAWASAPGALAVGSGDGRAAVAAPLPAAWAGGAGTLSCWVRSGGQTETVSRTLPLLAAGVELAAYPEGGDLVAGLPTRVYVAAREPWGDPAGGLRGCVAPRAPGGDGGGGGAARSSPSSSSSACVAEVVTGHEGRGVSPLFTPAQGTEYEFRVTHPAEIRTAVALPPVQESGATLRALKQVYRAGEPLDFEIACTAKLAHLKLVVYKREKELSSITVKLNKQKAPVQTHLTVPSTPSADGVLRVTLFDAEGTPLAERLIFRLQASEICLQIAADKEAYTPGESVELTLTATQDGPDGKPARNALIYLTVTDTRVAAQLRRRDRAPGPRAAALLEAEVGGGGSGGGPLADAGAYLPAPAGADPDAYWEEQGLSGGEQETAERMDMLLGTQGWRRFVYADPESFLETGEVKLPTIGQQKTEDKSIEEDQRKRLFGVGRPEEEPMAAFGMARGGFMMMEDEAMMDMEMAAPMMAAAGGGAAPRAKMARMAAPEMAPITMAGEEAGAVVSAAAAEANGAWSAAGAAEEEEWSEAGIGAGGGPDSDWAATETAAGEDLGDEDFGTNDDEDYLMLQDEPISVLDGDMRMDIDPQYAGRRPKQQKIWTGNRVYAHKTVDKNKASSKKTDDSSLIRKDFTETVYFAGELVTDEKGMVKVNFDLSESVATFRAAAWGAAADGRLGEAPPLDLAALKPLALAAKLPAQVTEGDRVLAPITVSLGGGGGGGGGKGGGLRGGGAVALALSAAGAAAWADAADAAWAAVADPAGGGDIFEATIQINPANTESSFLLPLDILSGKTNESPETGVTIRAELKGKGQGDAIYKQLQVNPRGFPQSASLGGQLTMAGNDNPSPQELRFSLPDDMMPGSFSAEVAVYPSPVASLIDAVSHLIQEPCGCFEQTSATTYPMALALQYLRAHASSSSSASAGRGGGGSGVQEMIKKAEGFLEKGYKKLVGFETKTGGFDWFGNSPGHEALSAYGVLQFTEMAKVMPRLVSLDMLARTYDWLISRRDKKGGFLTNEQALDSFGRAPKLITDAYIVYSLVEAGKQAELTEEIESLYKHCTSPKFEHDSYTLALTSATFYLLKRSEDARSFAQRLAGHQQPDGAVEGALGTITSSAGRARLVETTAAAALAWLMDDSSELFTENIERAIRWIAQQCKKGMYGGTQSTVLSLKAILAYETKRSQSKQDVQVAVFVDSKEYLIVSVPASAQDIVSIALPSTVGEIMAADGGGSVHTIKAELRPTSDSRLSAENVKQFMLPFSTTARWRALQPASDKPPSILFSTKLSTSEAVEGEVVELCVEVTNPSAAEATRMVVASVGVPGGLELRDQRLRDLKAQGDIAFSQTQGQELELYWEGLHPKETKRVCVDGVAAIPGDYQGQASKAFVYYGDENRAWDTPLLLSIQAASSFYF